jgi:hypothetical protein
MLDVLGEGPGYKSFSVHSLRAQEVTYTFKGAQSEEQPGMQLPEEEVVDLDRN